MPLCGTMDLFPPHNARQAKANEPAPPAERVFSAAAEENCQLFGGQKRVSPDEVEELVVLSCELEGKAPEMS